LEELRFVRQIRARPLGVTIRRHTLLVMRTKASAKSSERDESGGEQRTAD
jgi:hypothetical protein